MNRRQVRGGGRQLYGRALPLSLPQRRRWRQPRLGLLQRRLLMLVVLGIAAGYGTWRLFAVTTVAVKAPARVVEIEAEVRKLTRDSWWQRNLLTLNDGALAVALEQMDPLVRSVEVRRKWTNGIVVTVALKQPSMGWSTGNQKYLLDRDGTAIGVLPMGSKLPVVNDGSNLPVQVGSRVVSARFVAFVTSLVPALVAEGFSVQALGVKDTTLDLSVTTNKGYRLVFDTSRGVDEELVDLRAVKALLLSQKKTPAEYIDLRIAGKAYYK